MREAFARKAAALLERGALQYARFAPLASVERAWSRRANASIAAQLDVPASVFAVGVGGSTLGGSYRTPLAIALARGFARDPSSRVALVGHGYLAEAPTARVVSPNDDVFLVGDEALLCARSLADESDRVFVTVGPTRQAALDCALAAGATIVVIDGVLDAQSRKLDLRVLALDALRPWGAGKLPPLGDLRAEPHALLEHADEVVTVASGAPPSQVRLDRDFARRVTVTALEVLGVKAHGARAEGTAANERFAALSTLAGKRIGLSTAIARPERVRALLAAHGVVPALIAEAPDHSPPRFPDSDSVDAWIITDKCASWLSDDVSHLVGHTPIYVLSAQIDASTVSQLATLADRAPSAP